MFLLLVFLERYDVQIYSDGYVMNNGEFHPISLPANQQFINDVQNGQIPSALQQGKSVEMQYTLFNYPHYQANNPKMLHYQIYSDGFINENGLFYPSSIQSNQEFINEIKSGKIPFTLQGNNVQLKYTIYSYPYSQANNPINSHYQIFNDGFLDEHGTFYPSHVSANQEFINDIKNGRIPVVLQGNNVRVKYTIHEQSYDQWKNPQSRELYYVVEFWDDGFKVNESEFRSLTFSQNWEFFRKVQNHQVPDELMRAGYSTRIGLTVHKRPYNNVGSDL